MDANDKVIVVSEDGEKEVTFNEIFHQIIDKNIKPDDILTHKGSTYIKVSDKTVSDLLGYAFLFATKINMDDCNLDMAIQTLIEACEVAEKTGKFPSFT